MATDLQVSAIAQEVAKIQQGEGSPYFRFEITIHAGGADIRPLQFLKFKVDRNYRVNSMDGLQLVVALGQGTLMNSIGPFQDDLKITINISQSNTVGAQRTEKPVLSRTYRAYLGDHIERPSDGGYMPHLQDTETADRSSIRYPRFYLEEVAVEQLRKQSLGYIGQSQPPFEIMRALLVKSCQALKLDKDEVIASFDLVPANNTTARNHVIIEDGTPVLEIPDLLQNKQGGIYSSGLGFYIQGRCVYTWPVYDTRRQAEASRVLMIMMAPSRHSVALDKTWREEVRQVIIYSAGLSKHIDDTMGNLNTEGNAVRFASADKLLEGFGQVKDNKVTVSRTKNNSEFSTTVMGNGQNFAMRTETTANPYLQASIMASKAVAILVVTWRRSNPELITPGMPTEVMFDYNGVIRTMEGVLLEAYHEYELEGQGMTADRVIASTSLAVAVDRNDPDYIAYLEGGGTTSPTPDIGEI